MCNFHIFVPQEEKKKGGREGKEEGEMIFSNNIKY